MSPAEATQGGFTVLTFRVPNERENAATTKVQLHFPTDTPIIGATVRQLPGWKNEVVRGPVSTTATLDGVPITQAVTSIIWTADDAANAVSGSEYQEFGVSVGPLPATDRVTFKALQTYDNGDVSRWIEQPVDGQAKPQAPAVVLRLNATGSGQLDTDGQPTGTGAAATSTGDGVRAGRNDASSGVTLGIAIAALVVAIAKRVAVDAIRHASSRPTLITVSELHRVADAGSVRFEDEHALNDLIAGLTPERREAFVITQIAGLSYAEAAEICGCPIGTIRSRVARAPEDLIAARAQGAEGTPGCGLKVARNRTVCRCD